MIEFDYLEERVFKKIPLDAMKKYVDGAGKLTKKFTPSKKWAGEFPYKGVHKEYWEELKKARPFLQLKDKDRDNTKVFDLPRSGGMNHVTVFPQGKGSKVVIRWLGGEKTKSIIEDFWANLESLAGQAAFQPAKEEKPAPTRPARTMGYCLKCNTPLEPGDLFCPSCGARVGKRSKSRGKR